MKQKGKIILFISFIILGLSLYQVQNVDASSNLLPFKDQNGETITYFNLKSNGIAPDDSLGAAFYKLGINKEGILKVKGKDYVLNSVDEKSVNPIAGNGYWIQGTNTSNGEMVANFIQKNSNKIADGKVYLRGQLVPRTAESSVIPASYVDHYNSDGSIDFANSNWTRISTLSDNLHWTFKRNGRDYEILPANISGNNYPLSSLFVKDLDDNTGYTYIFNNLGSGTTSSFDLVVPNISNEVSELTGNYGSATLYCKRSPYADYYKNNNNAIAIELKSLKSSHFGPNSVTQPNNSYISEIVDINDKGLIQHYVTYTEKTSAKSNFEFGALRDTDLSIFKDAILDNEHRYPSAGESSSSINTSPGDHVSIIKGPGNSVYVTAENKKNSNIELTSNIHYIDVTGKTKPVTGWQPSSGKELANSPEVITTQKSDLKPSYDLKWLQTNSNYILEAVDAQSRPDVNEDATKYSFPTSLINHAVKTDFQVFFSGINQYVVDFNYSGTKRYSYDQWINANNFSENQVIIADIDSTTISTQNFAYLDKDQSCTVPYTEEVVSSGELAQNNTMNYYVYVKLASRTSLRAIPNFDFGNNLFHTTNKYFLSKDIPQPNQPYLNLDFTKDNLNLDSGIPIQKYLDLGSNGKARSMVMTDSKADDTDNWQVEASLSNFYDDKNKVLESDKNTFLTLNSNKIKVKGIADNANNSNPTYAKSVSPVLVSNPILIANGMATPILLGKNGSRSAVGSWLVDFGDKSSASLNFPVKNINVNNSKIKATLTWTLLSKAP